MVSTCMVFSVSYLSELLYDIHDNSAATSLAHAPYIQHAGNTNASAQCTKISIPKHDRHIHTYIHTDAKRDAKQDYLPRAKALGNYVGN